MATNIQPRYRCPQCAKPVERGELVVFEEGGLLHLRCVSESGEAIEAASGFLRRHMPARFCHTCLSSALRIPAGDGQHAVQALRATPGFYIVVGDRCVVCGQARVTIQYDVEIVARPRAA